jgi:hypothetical protein
MFKYFIGKITRMKTLYLVMLSHSMDDIPLAIFEKVGDAVEFAKAASWNVPKQVAKALNAPDCSTPNVISVVMFVDGAPVIREFHCGG